MDDETYAKHLEEYNTRLIELRNVAKGKLGDKSAFIAIAYETGVVDQDFVKKATGSILKCEGNSDFVMICLIRLLFLDENKFSDAKIQQQIRESKEHICHALSAFPFWPVTDEKPTQNVDKIVFWSENHIFMTLSCAYLYNQYCQSRPSTTTASEGLPVLDSNAAIVNSIFLKYLDIHLDNRFNGVYEVNSHVYLPYTMSALLNIFDFASDLNVREKAARLINRIVYHVMLCTDPLHGVANLSASARAFDRTRLRNFGHNINQLVNLTVGKSQDEVDTSQLADFLAYSSWRPSKEAYEALYFVGFVRGLKLSHTLEELSTIYGCNAFSTEKKDENVPLYWSAGLITHPAMIRKTREYQRRKHLGNNTHLWPLALSCLSDNCIQGTSETYHMFSLGQQYLGIKLNVFKNPRQGLLLSSFDLYNAHLSGFQQLPWMANISGVPVWTQAGTGKEGIMKFGLHNTHSPAVQQRDGLLVATYITPKTLGNSLITGALFPFSVRLFWPRPYFEGEELNEQLVEHINFGNEQGRLVVNGTYPSSSLFRFLRRADFLNGMLWMVGRVRGCYIGVLCTAETEMDASSSHDATIQPLSQDAKRTIPRRICKAIQHSWVVVVATSEEYPDISSFIRDRLSNIVISEEVGNIYKIIVKDGVNHIDYTLNTKPLPKKK
eukprot:gene10884-12098_t